MNCRMLPRDNSSGKPFYRLKIVSNQLISKRCWKQRNCLVNKCSLPTGSFVNFEGVTSWPLIRQTPPASDQQLQIEISMRQKSLRNHSSESISIHLPSTWVLQTLKPPQTPYTRSEIETSSGSHLAVSRRISLSLATSQAKGKLLRNRTLLQKFPAKDDWECRKKWFYLTKKQMCVCVCRLCSIFNLWYSWTKGPFKDDELLYWYFCHFHTKCHHVAHTCTTQDP